MRNLTQLSALALVAACASAACATVEPNNPRTGEDRLIVASGDGIAIADVAVRRDDYVQTTVIDEDIEEIWYLLPDVYAELGLPLPIVDRSSRTVAAPNHSMMRRLGNERLSRFINCGSDMVGQFADSYRVRLSVRTWLEPSGGSTAVRSRVEAWATPVEGRAGTIACSSRGELEKRIVAALRAATTD